MSKPSVDKGIRFIKEQIDAPVASFFSACVHCGLCAEACLFYTETKDPRYTPINKVEPMRRIWEQEYTLWGKLKSLAGLSKPVTEQDFADWEVLVYDGCSMCGRCSLVCPVGNDISGMIRSIREGFAAAGPGGACCLDDVAGALDRRPDHLIRVSPVGCIGGGMEDEVHPLHRWRQRLRAENVAQVMADLHAVQSARVGSWAAKGPYRMTLVEQGAA